MQYRHTMLQQHRGQHLQGAGGGSSSSWNPMPLRQSTTKIPPGWTDADSNNYSFRQWKRDLNLWCISTELNDAQIAPAVVQRLGGMVRETGLNLAEIRSTNHTTGAVGTTWQYGANVDLGDGLKWNGS